MKFDKTTVTSVLAGLGVLLGGTSLCLTFIAQGGCFQPSVIFSSGNRVNQKCVIQPNPAPRRYKRNGKR